MRISVGRPLDSAKGIEAVSERNEKNAKVVQKQTTDRD